MTEKEHILINELIQKSLDGELSSSESKTLSDFVSKPENTAYYIQCLHLNCQLKKYSNRFSWTVPAGDFHDSLSIMLEELAEYETQAPTVQLPARKKMQEPFIIRKVEKTSHAVNKFYLYTAILSTAALILILFSLHFAPEPRVLVGRLTKTLHAKWQDASGQIAQGCDLYSGPLKLADGIAQITFESGAEMLIEGPCSFELESDSKMFLNSGRIVVNIENSESGRFVVRTAAASIVDYGTEFGVEVDSLGVMRTHVYQGEVELRQGSDPLKYEQAIRLVSEQSAQATAEGGLSEIRLDPKIFVRKELFDTLVLADEGSTYHRWKAYIHRMYRDPSLVAHYTFEEDPADPDRLKNSASLTEGRLEGFIATESNNAPKWVPGRWLAKQAMRFETSKNQYVSISPDPALSITGPITIAVWGMFPEEGSEYNSGFSLSCRHGYKVNYFLRISERNCQFKRYYADQFIEQDWFSLDIELPKRWCHWVVTHDGQMVQYYLNGALLQSYPLKFRAVVPVEEGEFRIGTGNEPVPIPNHYHTIGILDEVAIYNRALSSSEVQSMYSSGKPD